MGVLAVSLQHTPVIRIVVCGINIHNEVTVSAEWLFGEEINAHVSLTISDYAITRIDLILDEEVPQVEMLRPLPARLCAVLCQ
jgi:hypothetical protein